VRVLGALAAVAIGAFLFARAVADAVAYHPTYVQRMKAQAESTEPQDAR
jgi:hypothetical protein